MIKKNCMIQKFPTTTKQRDRFVCNTSSPKIENKKHLHPLPHLCWHLQSPSYGPACLWSERSLEVTLEGSMPPGRTADKAARRAAAHPCWGEAVWSRRPSEPQVLYPCCHQGGSGCTHSADISTFLSQIHQACRSHEEHELWRFTVSVLTTFNVFNRWELCWLLSMEKSVEILHHPPWQGRPWALFWRWKRLAENCLFWSILSRMSSKLTHMAGRIKCLFKKVKPLWKTQVSGKRWSNLSQSDLN